MICYKCGQEVGNAKRCPNCGADLSVFLKVRHISNAYYNLGLEQAGVRNLSGAPAKKAYLGKKGKKAELIADDACRWNHRLAFHLAEKNRIYSEEHYDKLQKIPYIFIYYYMCFIRVLLSF